MYDNPKIWFWKLRWSTRFRALILEVYLKRVIILSSKWCSRSRSHLGNRTRPKYLCLEQGHWTQSYLLRAVLCTRRICTNVSRPIYGGGKLYTLVCNIRKKSPPLKYIFLFKFYGYGGEANSSTAALQICSHAPRNAYDLLAPRLLIGTPCIVYNIGNNTTASRGAYYSGHV